VRQQNLPDIADATKGKFNPTIPAHGVVLYRLTPF